MAIFPSRPINDPQVTASVVVQCSEHGYGVFGWYTEFEARSTAKELDKSCSCGSHFYAPVTFDEDGELNTPIEARDIINEFVFGVEEL